MRDRAGESLTSFTHLTREDIARRPTEDGNITDLLKSNPAVQFSNHGDGSLQMGEIKPSNISIHGSVAYQNNYTLDGISTNSDLDPAEQTSVTTTRLGGSDEQPPHRQRYRLRPQHSRLLRRLHGRRHRRSDP